MSRQGILALMMRRENLDDGFDSFMFSAAMATLLDEIADKLTPQELAFLVKAGARIYQAGVREFGSSLELEEMLSWNKEVDQWSCAHGYRTNLYRRNQ
jgi:hypothetical protein